MPFVVEVSNGNLFLEDNFGSIYIVLKMPIIFGLVLAFLEVHQKKTNVIYKSSLHTFCVLCTCAA